MTTQELEAFRHHPAFTQLVRGKQRLTWSLTLCMLVIYYGFVLVMAFLPETLGRSISGGVTSVGIPIAIAIILLSFALTAFYVRITNKHLDPLMAKLLRETLA
ncbi:MAG: hypothetical protein CMK99_15655 [Pseudomonas sp.]|nr:hypothetical protein [Pseudomonas sp.]HBS77546.1 DUF485 domain-containing protein [Pseudomonas sp.]|tara:strand:- start:37680 stop:37988 length:309 start_codon:yes stop_codon:yes gene_type:complete